MSKQPKAKSNRKSAAVPGGKKFTVGMVVFLVLAAVAIPGLWLNRSKLADTLNPTQTAEPKMLQGTAAKVAPTAGPGFQKLTGRWLRPDGGYILEIKGVDASGKMEAAYFNPRPIHVARAEAVNSGDRQKVFIELRDVNYPGSTYTLGYNPVDDRLEGIYFQAAMEQTFEVQFVRLQP